MSTKPAFILAADDLPEDRAILEEVWLELFPDDRFSSCAGGHALLEALRTSRRLGSRPQLVLLDVDMPDLMGVEVLKALRSDGGQPWVPVVMLSDSALPADVQSSYRHGAAGYIVKPSSCASLARVLTALRSYWVDAVIQP